MIYPYPSYVKVSDLVNVKNKTRDWALEVVENYYFNWSAVPLTKGKDVVNLRAYANGNQSVAKIKKSLFRLTENTLLNTLPNGTDRSTISTIAKKDLTGIEWTPVGVLFNLLNAAKANVLKQPINPVCTAIDPLAKNQKAEDMLQLKYERYVKEELDEYARKLKIKVKNKRDLQYGELMADIDKLDLNPENDDELQLIESLFYKLNLEAAMETMLQYDEYVNKMELIKKQILDDQYVLGVSVYEKYMNNITGLPDVQYYSPNNLFAPPSAKPDYSDVPFMYAQCDMSVEDFIKFFGEDLKDESQIAQIFDNVCQCNKWSYRWNDYKTPDQRSKRNRLIMPVIKMQWKTWDGISIVEKTKKGGKKYTDVREITYDDKPEGERTETQRWKQCTYEAYYVPCAKKLYRLRQLDATYNAYGDQSMSMFGFNIYQSTDKSAVEQCCVLVDNFQKAFFKMEHALLKSRPAGYNINIKHLRNAAENVKEANFSWKDLLTMFMQENILLTDSGDYQDREVFNNPAIQEIKGTNMAEVLQYWNIMANIKQQMREVTGINETRDATSPTPDSLVGLQKLALEASLNATYYIDDAIKHTIEDGYRWAACLIQYILKPENEGTKPYEALMAFAGRVKPAVIEAAGKLHMHQLGIKIEDIPTDAEQAFVKQVFIQLFGAGKLEASDLFALQRIKNYKDAEALAIVRERKKAKQMQQQALIPVQMQAQQQDKVLQANAAIAHEGNQTILAKQKMADDSNEKIEKMKAGIDTILDQMKTHSQASQIDQRHNNQIQADVINAGLEKELQKEKPQK